MATEMQLRTACLHVKKGGISLVISDEKSGRIARLKVSNGSLTWFPRDQKKGYVLSWKSLGEFAVRNGTRQK